MIYPPATKWNSFEYVVIAALRAHQLMRGCSPRVPDAQKATTTALREVVAGKVEKLAVASVPSS